MTRSSAPTTYDDDFYAWTQEQAAALRALPPGAVGDDVDIAHVAEEIEDMGRRDLREVKSSLVRVIDHLIKIEASPRSRDQAHWTSEAFHFQSWAGASFSPSMRRLLDVEQVWRDGRKAALVFLKESKTPASVPDLCPFTLDELLSHDFDFDAALAKVASAMRGAMP